MVKNLGNEGNISLGIGYIFSFLTLLSFLGGSTAIFAFFTYPISIILRAIGWIRLGISINKYLITGIAVIILAPIYYIGFLYQEFIIDITGLGVGQLLVILLSIWLIYSIFEAIGYFMLSQDDNKIFYGALISIVGFLILIYNLPIIWVGRGLDILALLLPSLPFLLLSSLFAAIGSFKLSISYIKDQS